MFNDAALILPYRTPEFELNSVILQDKQRHHEYTGCGERTHVKWTCGDILCPLYVGKEQNNRSNSKGECMVMKKRFKYKRTFMNKTISKNNCMVELN